jgi:NAD(P)-dependent dehydrogenase (short-subunit alcohol dehydrogenase family)
VVAIDERRRRAEGLADGDPLAQEVEAFGIHVSCVEPGPYATEWLSRGARQCEELPDYAPARAATAPEFEVGDPAATAPAILRLVDTEKAPRRLLLGRSFPAIEAIYD